MTSRSLINPLPRPRRAVHPLALLPPLASLPLSPHPQPPHSLPHFFLLHRYLPLLYSLLPFPLRVPSSHSPPSAPFLLLRTHLMITFSAAMRLPVGPIGFTSARAARPGSILPSRPKRPRLQRILPPSRLRLILSRLHQHNQHHHRGRRLTLTLLPISHCLPLPLLLLPLFRLPFFP